MNPFEDELRRRLHGAEDPDPLPADDLWAALEGDLPTESHRPFAWWKAIGGLAGLALLLTLALYHLPAPSSGAAAGAMTIDKEQGAATATKAQPQAERTRVERTRVERLQTRPEQSEQATRAEGILPDHEQTRVERLQTRHEQSEQTTRVEGILPDHEQSEQTTRTRGEHLQVRPERSEQTTRAEGILPDHEQSEQTTRAEGTPPDHEQARVERLQTRPEQSEQSTRTEGIPPNHEQPEQSTQAEQTTPEPANQSPKPESPNPPLSPSHHPHHLQLTAATNLLRRANPTLPEGTTATYEALPGTSLALRYHYRLSPTLSLGTGLEYQRTHQAFRFRSRRDSTLFDPVRNRLDRAIATRTVTHNNYATTLALPLEIALHRSYGNLDLSIAGGAAYHVALSRRGRDVDANGRVFSYDEKGDDYLTWRVRPAAHYRLTESLGLGLEFGVIGTPGGYPLLTGGLGIQVRL